MPARLNATWHSTHPMPKNATLDQRVRWHMAHARACACREIPESVREEMQKRGLDAPGRRKRAR